MKVKVDFDVTVEMEPPPSGHGDRHVVVKLAGRPVYRRMAAFSDEQEVAMQVERAVDALARLLASEMAKPLGPGALPKI